MSFANHQMISTGFLVLVMGVVGFAPSSTASAAGSCSGTQKCGYGQQCDLKTGKCSPCSAVKGGAFTSTTQGVCSCSTDHNIGSKRHPVIVANFLVECVTCPAGYMFDKNNKKCRQCWPGTVVNAAGTGCTNCPSGMQAVNGKCEKAIPTINQRGSTAGTASAKAIQPNINLPLKANNRNVTPKVGISPTFSGKTAACSPQMQAEATLKMPLIPGASKPTIQVFNAVISNSVWKSDFVFCHYKSQSGEINNLTYKIKCENGVLIQGKQHTYACEL